MSMPLTVLTVPTNILLRQGSLSKPLKVLYRNEIRINEGAER